MRVIIFGASGMVGKGVLLECLDDDTVGAVTAIGRTRCGVSHEKLVELPHGDFFDYSGVESSLAGHDACFFCLGVSSAGMREDRYTRLTLDLTLAAAGAVLRASPDAVFCYVSGAGTDGTERGRSTWARVKGRTENRLLAMPFRAAYMFRPGYIQPLRGIRSKTCLYQAAYTVLGPLFPIWQRLAPDAVTTTVKVGRAMIRVARDGYSRRVLETRDINALAG
jgi:nucleoside-diphosphate-sugar epimerase